MNIHFIGQSGFIIELQNGKRIGIDVWLENPVNRKELVDIPKLDYVLLTHDHPDHGLQDAIALAKRDKALFSSSYSIAQRAQKEGVEHVEAGNVGGWYSFGSLQIMQTIAHHSSNTGRSVGFIVKTPQDGTFYHLGDTGYFSELEFYGRIYNIDLVFIPIGSRFTMDTEQAAHAIADLQPKYAIPMHYNTFEAITADPKIFVTQVSKLAPNVEVIIMQPDMQKQLAIA